MGLIKINLEIDAEYSAIDTIKAELAALIVEYPNVSINGFEYFEGLEL